MILKINIQTQTTKFGFLGKVNWTLYKYVGIRYETFGSDFRHA